MMPERIVCGSYPGAIAYRLYTDEPPESLARSLCESADCDYYSVDGATYERPATTEKQ